jgi:hypothetical protein
VRADQDAQSLKPSLFAVVHRIVLRALWIERCVRKQIVHLPGFVAVIAITAAFSEATLSAESGQAISVLSPGQRFKINLLAVLAMVVLSFLIVFICSLVDRRWGFFGVAKTGQFQSTKSLAIQSAIVTVFFMIFGFIWYFIAPPIETVFSWIAGKVL